jgi:hypothetical protein
MVGGAIRPKARTVERTREKIGIPRQLLPNGTIYTTRPADPKPWLTDVPSRIASWRRRRPRRRSARPWDCGRGKGLRSRLAVKTQQELAEEYRPHNIMREFSEGMTAYLASNSRNPYSVGSVIAQAWTCGFDCAHRFERQEGGSSGPAPI